jgi:4-amino-4-deoxy-L-arabinose transferase-like glycosyltransferase
MSTSVLRRPFALRTRLRRETRDAAWVRPALIGLLAATAIAYLWNLTASGDANSFYAAAIQAGTKSWKAFLFGSLDSSNFITVDKPPASLWVMALSGRIFGFSSFSMLAPQVLEGVAAVGLLYAGVKRWFGPGAGLLAGALLACTPVAALMFRFNNPDALLVCLLVASAYCLVRALERASTRWIIAVGTLIGFAFLAKMLQAFLVLPGFALVYLVVAPTGLRRRAAQLLAGCLAIVVSAGWWVALVALWPVGSRPMIDGSPDNNIFNLILGYNGLGRIFGASGPGGGGGGANFSGPASLLRLFDDLMGGQASWLLPAALLALAIGLWSTRGAPRTDRTRAALLLWGSWLVVSGLVFSLSTGVIHTYYTVALAPAIAALVAIGAVGLWRDRRLLTARLVLALAIALIAGWSWTLLDRTAGWELWLRPLIGVSAALAVVCLLAPSVPRRLSGRVLELGAVLAAICCLAGPVAYTAQTLSSGHTGSIPFAGPSSALTAGGGGGPGGIGGGAGPPAGARGGGVGGGAPGDQTVSSSLVKALEADAGHYRWVAAVSGSQTAASLELGTGGDPVMAIGGFNGQGGNLSLSRFKQYLAAGEIHYYISGGRGGGPGGQAASGDAIASWVQAHFKSETIGGQTVYDLTQAS